jgi:DNA polymerase I-like protein with 3'-5' exonuclease and polymerase domains
MIKAVEDRADIHIRTAAMMFKAPEDIIKIEAGYIEEATDELYIAEQRQKMLEETNHNVLNFNPLPNMSMRQSGKKCNHSFNYGLSPNGFSIQYDMPLPFSRRCHSLYHSGYPGIHLGHKTIERELTNTRTLVNLFGRKRRFLGRMDDNLFKAAYSYKPQSSIGELLNRGIVTTYYDQFDNEHESYMKPQELLNQVHDSLLFQYPITTEEEIINFTHCILRTTKNLTIPMTANGRTFNVRTDGKIGFNGKKMEKIIIDKGFDACYESVVKAITKLKEQPITKSIELINDLTKEMEELDDKINEETTEN